MRYVILTLFLLFGTMPVQASVCDMQGDNDSSLGQHAGMDHGDDAMECCDADTDNSSCDSPTGCNTGFNSYGDVIHPVLSLVSPPAKPWYPGNDSLLPPATDAPPFRPPIS